MYSLSSFRQARFHSTESLHRIYGCLAEGKHFLSWNFAKDESGSQISQDSVTSKRNVSAPFALRFQRFIHLSGQKDVEMGRNSSPMDFVRGIIEEDGKGFLGSPQQSNVDQTADVVHIKMLRNNTFVTVTDSKGNKKMGASSGCLPELKGGPKLSRYAAEATAEHVGRLARNFGLKSVIMRVNGFTYFKKKRQAIMSFREGFSNSRDHNPIVYIEDTTRRPHNGCRLPRQRRI